MGWKILVKNLKKILNGCPWYSSNLNLLLSNLFTPTTYNISVRSLLVATEVVTLCRPAHCAFCQLDYAFSTWVFRVSYMFKCHLLRTEVCPPISLCRSWWFFRKCWGLFIMWASFILLLSLEHLPSSIFNSTVLHSSLESSAFSRSLLY